MKFLSVLFASVVLWLVSVAAYAAIAAIWLNAIGQFGFSFRALVGIAGILTAIDASVAVNSRQR